MADEQDRDEAIDQATTLGRRLCAARLFSVLAENLEGTQLDVARAIPELVFTKSALLDLAQALEIKVDPQLWGADIVKLIARELDLG